MIGSVALALSFFILKAEGHGMMLDPPNRASLWRIDWTQPANYEDNQYFCGGVDEQYKKNGGRCGECGDNYSDPKPRSNENGGYFGNGVVLRNYPSGSVIAVDSTLTANHMGTISYSLCVLENATTVETESCFQPLSLEDDSPRYIVKKHDYYVRNLVKLPDFLTCERCVLRWHYKTGNSWGVCEDLQERIGCGNQETFRSCADISIY